MYGLTSKGHCSCRDGENCPCPGKHPRGGSGWQHQATNNPDHIRGCFQAWPEANVGLLLGSLVDVEFDDEQGRATAERLLGNHLLTPTYRSARSVHRLYLPPVDLRQAGAWKTVQGLEIRLGQGRAAQSVLPPSRHASGVTYAWLPGLDPFTVQPLPFPQPLVDLLSVIESPAMAATNGDAFVMEYDLASHPGVKKGSRNEKLCELVGKALAAGETVEQVTQQALGWNIRCHPPEDPQKVQKTVFDLAAKEMAKRQTQQQTQQPDAAPLRIRPLSSVDYTPDEFLWGQRLVVGHLSVIAGDGQVGKTTVVCSLAARLSRGLPLPGDAEGESGATLIVSAEDSSKTIRGRIESAGGDLDRVFILDDEEDLCDYRRSSGRLAALLRAIPDIKLVCFDTLPDFVGDGIDDHKNSSIRQSLKPIVRVAAEARIAAVGICHFRKTSEGGSGSRLLGSVAYRNYPRSVLYCLPNVDAGEGECIVWHEKANLSAQASTLGYRVKRADALDVGVAEWLPGEIYVDSINRFMDADRKSGKSTKIEEAKAWLTLYLPEGCERQSDLLVAEAVNRGISKATLYRAADALAVAKDQNKGTWKR